MMWRVFGLTVLLAAPVAAQDRMTQAQCEQTVAGVGSMITPDFTLPEITVSDAGWCVATDLLLPVEGSSQVGIDRLEFRASDVVRFLEQGLPPRAFELAVSGARTIVTTGDPMWDYLMGVQLSRTSVDFGFSIRWDGVQNAILLDDAYLNLDETNEITASGRIDGVNLTDLTTIQTSLGSAGLRSLTLESTFDGWFETMGALIIGPMILQSNDIAPEVQVAALQQRAATEIEALPDAFMAPNSRDALIGFLNALPYPQGTAQLQITAEPTIGVTRFAPVMMNPTLDVQDVVESALGGVTVFFKWDQTGD